MKCLFPAFVANILFFLILSGCSSCSQPDVRTDDPPTAEPSATRIVPSKPVVAQSPVDCPHVAKGLKEFAIKKFREKEDAHLVRVVVDMSGASIPNWNALEAQVEITTPTKARVMIPAKNICLLGASEGVLLVQPR